MLFVVIRAMVYSVFFLLILLLPRDDGIIFPRNRLHFEEVTMPKTFKADGVLRIDAVELCEYVRWRIVIYKYEHSKVRVVKSNRISRHLYGFNHFSTCVFIALFK